MILAKVFSKIFKDGGIILICSENQKYICGSPRQIDPITLKLLKKDAYRKGEFTLSSGKNSEHYVNCKPVTLSSDGLWMVSDLLLQHVDDDVVAGLTLGADPIVSGCCCLAAANGYKLSGLIIRKEPKGYGTASQVEGPLPPKETIDNQLDILDKIIYKTIIVKR